ncbi:MAG: hypothetical protein IJO03_06380 [Clostridia bacterium]|nr:hypothetical protein [Clostridia bacterium]
MKTIFVIRSDGVFVILRVNNSPKGFLKSRNHRKALEKARAESISTEKGLPFFILDIPERMNDSSWERIAEKCGRYASRIVAPRCLSLPDCGRLKRFIPSFTPSLLVFNTALSVLDKASIDPCTVSITLTDRNALHPSRVHRLLPFSSTVRVITSHPEKYASACKNALDEYGASLIIRSAYEPGTKRDIVICSDGGASPLMKGAAVFTHKQSTAGRLRFCCSGVELTDAHKKILPPDIEPTDFAGAVTELCGSSEYKRAVFSNIASACNICDDPSPEMCLRCYCEGRV